MRPSLRRLLYIHPAVLLSPRSLPVVPIPHFVIPRLTRNLSPHRLTFDRGRQALLPASPAARPRPTTPSPIVKPQVPALRGQSSGRTRGSSLPSRYAVDSFHRI